MSRLTSAFTDPARRPRTILWAGVALLALAALVVTALGVTSSRWFCSEGCHKVQDDTIAAYQASPHSEISCYACHMPANASPITFALHKVKNLGELYLTLTGDYELPLNGESHLALAGEEMGSEQCTQCHGTNRVITPSPGVIIDHAAHAAKDIRCTVCHNRVAHVEKGELTLVDPKSGRPNRKHEDFMLMEGCFRCHTQAPGEASAEATGEAGGGPRADAVFVTQEAPGRCDACHPKDFELRPPSHLKAGFYTRYGESKGHAELASEDRGYCLMCHNEAKFCQACHQLPMPHPDDFEKTHGTVGRAKPAVCANCHNKSGKAVTNTEFCNSCHHADADPAQPWIPQHFRIVAAKGAAPCFECHKSTFCASCHIRGIAR